MSDAFDYVESRADADTLIAEFGQDVSLRHSVNSGTPWAPTQTPTDYPTKAAILDYSARQINGETVLATDRRALVAAGPLDALGVTSIAVPDRLVVAGVALSIVRVVTLAPAGTVVLYDCQLRA